MMEIKCSNGEAHVFTPYNKEFITRIKKIGGARWNSSLSCWIVPENCIGMVREFMQEIYGFSDVSENETVNIKVIFNCTVEEKCSSIIMFGKTIARAFDRD